MSAEYNNKITPADDLSRAQLTAERITLAAIDLLNEEGLEKLSMRRLADALGARAASLYWHVKNKEALLQLISENICGNIKIPNYYLTWDEQIKSLLSEYRKNMLAVRDSAVILANTSTNTPKRLKIIDAMYKILLAAGLSPEDVILTSKVLNNYMLFFVMDEMRILSYSKEQEKSIYEVASSTREFYLSLPTQQYPNIVRLADYSSIVNRDREFEFGLNVIITGLKYKTSFY